MKSKINKIALSLILAICMIGVFSGCTVLTQTIVLQTPTSINIQPISSSMDMQEISSENMQLITEENPLASAYIFYVYEGEYNALVTSIESFTPYQVSTNYLAVNDIFVLATSYHYYVIYKGQTIGKIIYQNSLPSEVKTYDNSSRLARPTVSISGTSISWTAVENATSYKVYENDVLLTTTSQTTYNFSSLLNTNRALTFKVQAVGSLYYSSAFSLERIYDDHLQLLVPTSLNLSEANTLSWTAVTNALTYTVKINNDEYQSATTSMNINQYIVSPGQYTISVKANQNVNFIESAYCTAITKTVYTQLSTPVITSVVQDENLITITWTAVPNAMSYSLKINSDVELTYIDSTSCIINVVSITNQEDTNIDLYVKANGYSFYSESEYSTAYNADIVRVLASPINVQFDDSSSLLTWSAVERASGYEVKINNLTTVSASLNSIDLSSYVSYGAYDFVVKALATGIYNNSSYSETVSVVNKFDTPQISDVYTEGTNFVIEWGACEQATEYYVYIGGNLITTVNTNAATIAHSESLKDGDYYLIYIIASNGTTQLNSDASQTYSYIGFDYALAPQNVTVGRNVNTVNISWDSCINASSYEVAINNTLYQSDTNSYSTSSLQINQVYAIRVRTKGINEDISDFSELKLFNYTNYVFANYSDKYFLYGTYQDYVITSQQEMNEIICSRFLYRDNSNTISSFDIHYIPYDGDSLASNLGVAMASYTSTHDAFSYSLSSLGFNNYRISITMNTNAFYPLDDVLVANSANNTTQYENQTLHYGSGRTNYDDFASDDYSLSAKANWTEELFNYVEWGIVPTFDEDSTADNVYYSAKTVLNTILEDGMTDYEKVLAINDWLCYNVDYDNDTVDAMYNTEGLVNSSNYTNARCYYLEGVFIDKLAVCDGFAKAFSLLCNMEGIDCVRILGNVDSDGGGDYGHAWNKVYLAIGESEPQWYVVDSTWNNTSINVDSNYVEIILYEHFLISDQQNTDHIEDYTTYPQASTSYNYYQSTTFTSGVTTIDLYIESQSELNEVMLYFANNSSTYDDFQIKLAFDYGANYSDELSIARNYCMAEFQPFSYLAEYTLTEFILFSK